MCLQHKSFNLVRLYLYSSFGHSLVDNMLFFHHFVSSVEGRFKKSCQHKAVAPYSSCFLSITYANNIFHTHSVMNVNQKHLKMQMVLQVHTSKLHAFVFYLRWKAQGPCLSHLAFICPHGPMMMKLKTLVAKSFSKSFEMLKYLS